MGRFFDPNSGIMGFMSKVADVIIASMLWLVCSIPIVTIGASTTALYYTVVKAIRRERSYVVRSFFSSFKENFIPGTVLWLLMMAVMVLLSINIRFGQAVMASPEAGRTAGYVLLAAYCFIGVVLGAAALYVFPVLSRFKMKKREILKMSLFMSIRHLPYTLLLALAFGITVLGVLFVPISILFAPAAGALLCSLPMERVLRQYIKQDETEEYTDEWYLE